MKTCYVNHKYIPQQACEAAAKPGDLKLLVLRADVGDELAPVQLPIHTSPAAHLLRYTYPTLSLSTNKDMSEPSQLLFVLKGQRKKTIFSEALPMLRSNVKDALTRKSQLVMWNPFCTEDI